jgi:Kef-type K+ transport system membrane component KefB
MSVVAIDDSVAIVLFGILVALANALAPSTSSEPLALQILMQIWEIFVSMGIGGAIGLILTFGCKWFTGRGNRISLVVASVFMTIYLADLLGGSSLLATMALGAVFANLSKKYEEVNGLIYFVTPPIFIMFFALSGAELDLSVLKIVGLVGFVYILVRICGKIFGAWLGAKITHADQKIKKYLGFALIPQAGVAIGLSLVATEVLDLDMGMGIRAIILAATLIYELIGPIVTKYTLLKAGEITLKG